MLTLVTPPADEPVSADQASVHARITPSGEPELADIRLKIMTARENREHFTQRQFIAATWRLTLCEFRRFIVLERPPLRSVTSVKYYDVDNVLQTIDNTAGVAYLVHSPAGERAARGSIEFRPEFSFPQVYDRVDAVQIEFVAGYGAAATAVPASLRASILLIFAELYAFREEQTVGTIVSQNLRAADNLCWPFRVVL